MHTITIILQNLRRFFMVMALAVLAAFSFSTTSFAQLLHVEGITGGTVASAIENAAGDALDSHVNANQKAGGAAVAVSMENFSMGRLRTTNSIGYKDPTRQKTAGFQADEWSALGAISFSMSGPAAGSRLSLTPFLGWSQMYSDIDANLGKASNSSLLYGGSAVYSVGSSYAALSVTGASGRTHVNHPFSGKSAFDTQGVVVSGLIGHVIPVPLVGDDLFAAFQGGLRYVNMAGDKYTSGLSTLQTTLNSTTALFSAEFYTSFQQGGMTLRPFIKNTLQIDLAYNNKVKDFTFSFAEKYQREALSAKTELGLNATSGKMNFTAAAFSELSADSTTFGGRLGVNYKFN